MQQCFDLAFQVILKCPKNDLLNLNNVNTLNAQVVNHFPNSDLNNTIVIVQKNRKKYLINCL